MKAKEYFKNKEIGFYHFIDSGYTKKRRDQFFEAMENYAKSTIESISEEEIESEYPYSVEGVKCFKSNLLNKIE